MAKDFIIKKIKNKGFSIFASRNYIRDEKIFHVNLTKLKKYTLKEIKEKSKLNAKRSNYVGKGKYVIDNSPASYMNHSCNPNCYIKMETIAKYDIYALREINKREELTHDHTATSVDQFAGKDFWKFKCKCNSSNCRKTIHGDFFQMPKIWQNKYYKNLPLSIRRKYKKLLKG